MSEIPQYGVHQLPPDGPLRLVAEAPAGRQVEHVAWNADGSRLAISRSGLDVQVCDLGVHDGRYVLGEPSALRPNARSLAWRPSRPEIAAACSEDHITGHDVARRRSIWTRPRDRWEHRSVSNSQQMSWVPGPGGEDLLAVIGQDRVDFLDAPNGELCHSAGAEAVFSIAGAPRAGLLAMYVRDRVELLDCRHDFNTRWDRRVDDHLFWMAWSASEETLCLVPNDGTIRLVDAVTGRDRATLEGHTGEVFAADFSSDGRLFASLANDRTVRLWNTETWQCVAVLDVDSKDYLGGVAFHPTLPLLATRVDGTSAGIIEYDANRLPGVAVGGRRYLNAKVVLVGDSGVGKSGLGLVLSGQPYQPTESTHGRRVATAGLDEITGPDGSVETRETMLWDLAGQPGYRLVHQLHLAQAAVAVMVFDARSEADPFAGVRYWARALENSARLRPDGLAGLRTILAAARVDRGGVPVPRQRIDELVEELRFSGYVETSAKEGWGVDQLATLIRQTIPWDDLPWSASTELFDTIKRFLWEEKNAGRILVTSDDLYRGLLRRHPHLAQMADLRASFITCIGLLEGRDVLRRLTFGGYVLLRPELLDAYASAIVDAARTEPDGLGFVSEGAALAGDFRMSGDERLDDVDEEKLLLIATVEELLRHDLALREVSDVGVGLVFPSQFTRNRPDAPEVHRLDVVFSFDGAVHSVYASLAVRLSHVAIYRRHEMYRNAAIFKAKVGGLCGIELREVGEGSAELGLFFDEAASEETRFLFEDYVHAHLSARAVPQTLKRRRVFRCPDETCGYELPDDLVRRWIDRKRTRGRCPACEEADIALLDREDRLTAEAAQSVSVMNQGADRQRDLAVAETTLKGKRASGTFDVFLSYRTADRNRVIEIAERLMERGILPWLDIWEIAPGERWQDCLARQIGNIRAVAVLIGSPDLGPWQDLEQQAFISQFVKRGCRVVPVFLPGTAPDVTLPLLLDQWHAVDFRQHQPEPFEQLVWGITGERPQDR